MRLLSYRLADFVSLANGFAGFLAIMYIIDGVFSRGMILILAGILIDGADGLLARRLGGGKPHGVYLDSIADTVTFCFAPSVLLYTMFYNLDLGTSFESPENALVVAASMVVVLFGILRLARFIERDHRMKNYTGLPTPAAALIIVLATSMSKNQFAVLTLSIVVSFLMISRIQYPKLSGSLQLISGSAVMLAIVSLILKGSFPLFMYTLVLVLLLAIIYVVIGPLSAAKSKGDSNGSG